MPSNLEQFRVFSDGTVISAGLLLVTNKCNFIVDDFPFDVQTCNVIFGSWMYETKELDIISIPPTNSNGFMLTADQVIFHTLLAH